MIYECSRVVYWQCSWVFVLIESLMVVGWATDKRAGNKMRFALLSRLSIPSAMCSYVWSLSDILDGNYPQLLSHGLLQTETRGSYQLFLLGHNFYVQIVARNCFLVASISCRTSIVLKWAFEGIRGSRNQRRICHNGRKERRKCQLMIETWSECFAPSNLSLFSTH